MIRSDNDLSGSVLSNDYWDQTEDGLEIIFLQGFGKATAGPNAGSFVATGTYGTLVLAPDGNFVYEANALSGVDEGVDTFVVTISDGSVNKTSNLVIKVTDHSDFDNTDEILTKTIDVTEGETVTGSGISTSDAGGDWDNITGVATGSGTPSSASVGQPLQGTWGSLTLNSDGTYSYTADDTYLLTHGQTTTDTFTFSTQGFDGKAISGEHQLIVNVTGINSAPTLDHFTIHITEDTTWDLSESNSILYNKINKYSGETSDLDAPNQLSYEKGWVHYLRDEAGDYGNNWRIGSVNGYGYYKDDEYKISTSLGHVGPVVAGSSWQAIYTAGEDIYSQTSPSGQPLAAFGAGNEIGVVAPDPEDELAAGETFTITDNEVRLYNLGNEVVGTFDIVVHGLPDPQPVLVDDVIPVFSPGNNPNSSIYGVQFHFGDLTGDYSPNALNDYSYDVTGNDSDLGPGTIAISVYDQTTQTWSAYIDADQDTIASSQWGSYQWDDVGEGRMVRFMQNQAFIDLSSGDFVDKFKYRLTPLDTSLNPVEAEVTLNLRAINDPMNYTLSSDEWIYMLAGTSTTISAAAANVGTTLESAVVGDHSGGLGLAGTTKERSRRRRVGAYLQIYQRPVLKQ